jgi:hypothetical protein
VISVFTAEARDRLRDGLLERAARDPFISGAAITGSASEGRDDRWSDIDLAFAVADAAALPDVLADWTVHMYERHLALHHYDVTWGAWIYRVFFLPGTLRVDLAFVPASEFRALAPTFRLVFGTSNEPRHSPAQAADAAGLIGLAWLYAIHARTCIARGKLWQAEYMIGALRDTALAMACIRHGLPSVHGRGIDLLPEDMLAGFEGSLVRRLEPDELSRAFQAAIRGLLCEIRSLDQVMADRIEAELTALRESA